VLDDQDQESAGMSEHADGKSRLEGYRGEWNKRTYQSQDATDRFTFTLSSTNKTRSMNAHRRE